MAAPLLGVVARIGGGLLRAGGRRLLRQFLRDQVEDLVKEAFLEAGTAALNVQVELDLENLQKLRREHRRAVYIGAARAAKPVRQLVIANAEKLRRFGFLAKSIGTKTRIYPGGVISVIGPKMSFVRNKGKRKRGPRKGEAIRHRPYLYSWLLERGTKRAAAKPFLRPAMDQAGPRYFEEVSRQIELELAKHMK